MAPPARYPSAITQLLGLLIDARSRGLTFEEAWTGAVRPTQPIVMTCTRNPPANVILWSSDSTIRGVERSAIEATKDSWRRAYEKRPATVREQAAMVLAAHLRTV
jgi:hypothetical protein